MEMAVKITIKTKSALKIKNHNSYIFKMRFNHLAKNKKGFSVLELVLAAAVFSIFSFGITLAVLQGMSAQQAGARAEAARLFAIEGIEAARALRSQGFDNLTDTSGSGIRFQGGEWELAGESDEWDGYSRVITIEKAERDGDGNIVSAGGDEDEDLKLITSTVAKGDYSIEYSGYLSRREIVPAGP